MQSADRITAWSGQHTTFFACSRRSSLCVAGSSNLLDPDQDAARAWRVRVIPSTFLVDAEGRVRYSVIGNLDRAAEDSVRAVRALMP
jgi:alkyl hydroperoxide reductase subunit AhpC